MYKLLQHIGMSNYQKKNEPISNLSKKCCVFSEIGTEFFRVVQMKFMDQRVYIDCCFLGRKRQFVRLLSVLRRCAWNQCASFATGVDKLH